MRWVRIELVAWCGVALATVLGLSATSGTGAQEAGRITNPFAGRSDLVEEGRSLFNQHCSHCHGPNAFQGERPRDLRRLKIRYGSEATRVFYDTVSSGRLDKGMPVLRGVLSEEVLWRIFTYLETVQAQP
jgi:mono/diheme cytochrome c family protein